MLIIRYHSPRRVEALHGVRCNSVVCGLGHTAALSTDGYLWTWGWKYAIECVEALHGVRCNSVVCGLGHTAALSTDGYLWT